jgi:hypothetical protein
MHCHNELFISHLGCCFVAAVAVQNLDDEPVWRQLLRFHLDHDDYEVAEKARICLVSHAAALWQWCG